MTYGSGHVRYNLLCKEIMVSVKFKSYVCHIEIIADSFLQYNTKQKNDLTMNKEHFDRTVLPDAFPNRFN